MNKFLISNFLRFPAVAYVVLRNLKRQKKYLNKKLIPLFREIEQENDGTVDAEDIRKITTYYGNYTTSVLGESFCTLRGKKMTEKERWAITCLGMITGIYDDFFDKRSMSQEDVIKISRNPDQFEAKTLIDKIFVNYRKEVLKNTVNKEFHWEMTDKIFESQVESKKQKNPDISFKEIKRITFEKGGYSVLLFRSVFEHPLQEGEYEALFNIGALFQLGNDIFDIYNDREQKINTLASTAGKINGLRKLFDEQRKEAFNLCYKTNYKSKHIKQYLHQLTPIITRCYVCMDQLEGLEKKTDDEFKLQSYSRKALVCDMEKSRNFLSSIWYYFQTKI